MIPATSHDDAYNVFMTFPHYTRTRKHPVPPVAREGAIKERKPYGFGDIASCSCRYSARLKTTASKTMPITLSAMVVTEIGMPGGMMKYTTWGRPSQKPCNTETKR